MRLTVPEARGFGSWARGSCRGPTWGPQGALDKRSASAVIEPYRSGAPESAGDGPPVAVRVADAVPLRTTRTDLYEKRVICCGPVAQTAAGGTTDGSIVKRFDGFEHGRTLLTAEVGAYQHGNRTDDESQHDRCNSEVHDAELGQDVGCGTHHE